MHARSISAAMIALAMVGTLVGGDLAEATQRTTAKKATSAAKTAKARTKTTRANAKASIMPAGREGPIGAASSSGAGPVIGGCPVFPSGNPWNLDISNQPLHPRSAEWVAAVNSTRTTLHPDTGSNPDYGIPYVVVPQGQPLVPITYTDYGDESDPGPFPIPGDAPVEAGSDRHVLVVQSGTCRLYELFNARRTDTAWEASSGAMFDLRSNALRPAGWTSADAAGLPILPGLLRYDEVASGEIRHALRFTVSKTQRAYISPARHFAGSPDARLPPMGARFRLRGDVDLTGYHGHALVVLRALQRYGMIVADNGSSWFITGAADKRWNDDDLGQLKTVPGSWFDVVDTGPVVTSAPT